jgi:hypothetical protein
MLSLKKYSTFGTQISKRLHRLFLISVIGFLNRCNQIIPEIFATKMRKLQKNLKIFDTPTLKYVIFILGRGGRMYPRPNLKDVQIKDIFLYGTGIRIKVIKNSNFISCPKCGTPTNKIHEYRTQLIIDKPYKGKKVEIELNKRRLICVNKNCPVKTFTEEVKGLQKRKRYTTSFDKFLSNLINKKGYFHAYRSLREKYNINISMTTLFYKELEIR